MLDELRALLGRLDAAVKECDDPIEAQAVIEGLDDIMRNDWKLMRSDWDAKRKELIGSGRVPLGDGRVAYTRPTWKYEWDHTRIAETAARRALYTVEGERLDSLEEVAARAVQLLAACYVTPSSEPRTEGLTALGFERKQAAARDRKPRGTEVMIVVPK